MNKLKSKYPNIDIFAVAVALLLFIWLFCSKMIIKMDDGHFMGILANEGFTLKEWLEYRYNSLSGRTIGEALMMTFLRIHPVFWKLLSASLFIYIIYFNYSIASHFDIHGNKRQIAMLSSASTFMIFVGVLNAGAFWYAGSFTFLIPCGFMLITLTPAVFSVLGIKCPTAIKILAVPFALIAASQEQAAVCTCAALVFLFAVSVIRKKVSITAYLPLIPAVFATIHLLTSPGAKARGVYEAAASFPTFNGFGFVKKIFLGFYNYCTFTFFFSIFTVLVFTCLLSLVICNRYTGKGIKKLAIISPCATAFVALGYNLLHSLIVKESVDAHFKKCFMNDTFDIWIYLTAAICAAVIILWAVMIILILRVRPEAGFTVGPICCAALGCAIMMGFSSSIFASGKRVFFYSEMLMVMACVVLFANIKPSKLSKIILGLCLAAAGAFYVFDIFNLSLFEIPVMN